jgi:hypothetical protein
MADTLTAEAAALEALKNRTNGPACPTLGLARALQDH